MTECQTISVQKDSYSELDYNHIVGLKFWDYAQVYEGEKLSNTNESRTVGAIAMYPSGNSQNGWMFMSSMTGERIDRYQWQTLPISDEVIQRVEGIVKKQGEPIVATNFIFEKEIGSEYKTGHPEYLENLENEEESVRSENENNDNSNFEEENVFEETNETLIDEDIDEGTNNEENNINNINKNSGVNTYEEIMKQPISAITTAIIVK